MSKRVCKDWLQEYLRYTRHSEAPEIFHFWTGVSVIAGALRRRVWIEQRYFQWTPNFYIFFVGPPGIITKSTTAKVGMNLLKEIDGVKFGPNSVTWQKLIDSFSEAQELVPMPDQMWHPMACITVVASELGSFFKPADTEMVDLLVDLWDGQKDAWQRATKMHGETTIENPWINIIGCTTPAWLAGNVPEYMIGGGFTSRSVFVYGDQKRQLVAYPAKQIKPGDFDEQRERLIHDLRIIASMAGEYELSPEAMEWGEEWYEKHWTEPRPLHMASERFGGYLARKQTHIHKLAMVLAASQRSELVITKDDLITANEFVEALEHDMQKVFKNVGAHEETRVIQEIIAVTRAFGKVPRRELYRRVLSMVKGHKEFSEALDSAIHAGYVTLRQEGNDVFIIPNSPPEQDK